MRMLLVVSILSAANISASDLVGTWREEPKPGYIYLSRSFYEDLIFKADSFYLTIKEYTDVIAPDMIDNEWIKNVKGMYSIHDYEITFSGEQYLKEYGNGVKDTSKSAFDLVFGYSIRGDTLKLTSNSASSKDLVRVADTANLRRNSKFSVKPYSPMDHLRNTVSLSGRKLNNRNEMSSRIKSRSRVEMNYQEQ